MLFNSYVFLFAFLPVTLVVYELLSRWAGKQACILWLTAASIFFYGWWSWPFAALLVASITFNAIIGHWLLKGRGSERQRKNTLLFGVGANLALLGYFKYANFLVEALSPLIPGGLQMATVILPIAISFHTFQQIAFLIDARHRTVKEFSISGYFLFVTFFPQLVAGPIVHHNEMMPQYAGKDAKRITPDNLAIGLSLFAIGLFKKVILADLTSRWADPVFAAASRGVDLSLAEAWIGTLAFTFQLYFDFSGYSDMALGLARMLGIVLPLNFQSPYKAASIIEFWQRWHMTLTRFFNQYLYTPMTLAAVRRRAHKGFSISTRAIRDPAEFATRLALPTIVTMTVIGIWHGAGFQFMVFGFLHGVYLTINHAWRTFRQGAKPNTWKRRLGMATTFVAVAVSFVFFRADSLETALRVLGPMAGSHGLSLGVGTGKALGAHAADLAPFGVVFNGLFPNDFFSNIDSMGVWMVILFILVIVAPSTYDLFRSEGIALQVGVRADEVGRLVWRRTAAWGLATGVMLCLAILQIQTLKPFIYFQF